MKLVLTLFIGCILASNFAAAQDCGNGSLSVANNKFAIDIYKELLKKKESIFFSPYSIYSALAMTAEGAKTHTATEMQQVMYSNGKQDCIAEDIKNTQLKYNQLLASGDSIRVANSLWVQKNMEVLPSFYKTTKDNYSAIVNESDFINATDPSRININKWVEKQTNNRIKDLLPAGSLNQLTRMVLVNAIWFKGKWANPFEHIATRDDQFFGTEKTSTVPFMHKTMGTKYSEDANMQSIELPYQSNKISMVVLLPVKGKETEFENNLSQEKIDGLLTNMKYEEVSVSLPKFKMETGFEAGDMLKQLGMSTAFSNNADFSGISEKDPLKISKVIHKAFIEVDEAGTEAAAATAVIMMKVTSVMPSQRIIKSFKADRPFTFMLIDRETKTILFMGKVQKI